MQIKSPVFGNIEIADEKVLDFPAGLPGFEHCRRFALVHEEGHDPDVFLLQSLDDAEVAFSVTGPERLGINFEFELDDEELALLQLREPADAAVAVIIRREAEDEAGPASTGLRANFMAPLVINAATRRGLQKVISKLGCEITLRAQS